MGFKITKLNKHSISTMGYRKHAAAVVFIVIFALIGVIILTSSHASSPYSSIEASTGTLSGSAATETDANASNGSYVKFGTAGGGGSSSSGGCEYDNVVAPCVGSSTTGIGGWGNPSFDDEFNGTSINTTNWNTEIGWNKNDITVSRSDESESGGDLILTLSDDYTGAEISTNTYELQVGGFAEARVDFPGSGTTIYNWPAWWTAGPGWPTSGEQDILEGDGYASINYHYQTPGCTITSKDDCDSQRGAYNVPGNWGGNFHTYGLYRGNGYVDFYYDGTLVDKYDLASTDDRGGENLILTNGCYNNSGCTTPAVMKVDYVRAWNTNSSGFTGTAP